MAAPVPPPVEVVEPRVSEPPPAPEWSQGWRKSAPEAEPEPEAEPGPEAVLGVWPASVAPVPPV